MPYKALIYIVLLFNVFLHPSTSTAEPNFAGSRSNVLQNSAVQSSTGFLDNNSVEQEFLRVEEAYKLDVTVEDQQLRLYWQIAEGYYLYGHRFDFTLQLDGKEIPLKPQMPVGKKKQDEYFGEVEVFYHQVSVSLPLMGDLASTHKESLSQNPLTLKVRSQGCADAGLCYPPYKQNFEINLADHSAKLLSPPKARQGDAMATSLTKDTSKLTTTGETNSSLPYILIMAALGGLILNLMPCVFPILTLKVLSFTGKDPDRVHTSMHGIVYTIGVILSFVCVAGLLIILQAGGEAIGWGFHLQSPWFVACLAYLFFVMGLAMSGLLELGARFMGLGGALADQSGYTGSFFTGVLAVVVASPCTAPFMGTALGYAMTQPPAVALSVFAALGFGMALPFLVLSSAPKLTGFMPKPGPWMDSFKRFMAFPLYATCIWLLWVIGNQTSVNGMAIVLLGCLMLALSIWLWHETVRTSGWKRRKTLGSATAAVIAVVILGSPLLTPNNGKPLSGDEDWHPYSAKTLQQIRSSKQPVFVDITADWCITCLANERVTLGTDYVKQAFRDNGVIYLKGDWTNHDPEITHLLRKYGRSGIPLYLLYPADPDKEATILPQLLTTEIVQNALDNINQG